MVEGPGVYTLEYGKGSKKIVGKLELGADKQWYLDAAGEAPYSKKREALAAWSAIAVANYGGTPAPPPRKAPSLAPPPRLTEQLAVPQLDGFFKEGSPQQIQDCINKGPTRADQIRRWYQAWQTTGNEFMLPAFVPMTPMKGPPRISPKDTNDTDSNPPEEAAPADPNQAIDVEAADVSGEQGADAPV
jgi:hypothetical protein